MSRRQRRARDAATRLNVVRAQVLRRRARRRGAKPAAATTAALLTMAGVGVPPATGSTIRGVATFQDSAPGAGTGRTAVSGASTSGGRTSGPSDPRGFVRFQGKVYFTADNGVHGRELWKSDGTRAGTVLVKNIKISGPGNRSNPGSSPRNLTAVGDTLFFTADDGVHGRELWKSDGTRAGTVLVRDINRSDRPYSGPSYLTAFGGRLFFSADDGKRGRELWRSDGTRAGTVLVKNIRVSGPGTGSNPGSSPAYLTALGGRLFFSANHETHGRELWSSDGTRAGTIMVKDITPGAGSSAPLELTRVGRALFFSADDGTHSSELWKSDGTRAGTVLVKDILPNGVSFYTNGSYPGEMTAVADKLFFTANDFTHGEEVWTSDGTRAGTVLVKDIEAGGFSPGGGPYPDPDDLTAVGGRLFFTVDDRSHRGRELWKSDGTRAGTVMVKDINAVTYSEPGSYPSYLTAVGRRLFLIASDGIHGEELWRSDGTEAGTVLVKDIITTRNIYARHSYLTAVGNTLFFSGDDGITGGEPWLSDGTRAGTVLVKDINTETG